MPGRSLSSGFRAEMTTLYVTTFWSTCGALRTCITSPEKVWLANESTVKVARRPSRMRPTSASSTLVSTCICVRSWAIVKSVGAWRLAATVWPDVHRARDDDAVHGGPDLRVVEVHLRLPEARLLLGHVGDGRLELGLGDPQLGLGGPDLGGLGVFLGLGRLRLGDGGVIRGLGRVLVGLGDEALLLQVLVARERAAAVHHRDLGLGGLGLGHGEGGLGIGEIGAGLLDEGALVEHDGLGRVHLGLGLGDRGLEFLRVDPGDELVALDLGIEVGEELLDLARRPGSRPGR